MPMMFGVWPKTEFRALKRLPLLRIAEITLLVALAAAVAALFWTLVRPLGPVGRWQAVGSSSVVADPTLLTRFDPFFRNASNVGSSAVTSLALKLFGTRLDQAMGRGSAIIATPDNVQNSFAIGDEIVPGVKLKSVAFDSVTIERGGVSEQLFLDQSMGTAVNGGVAGPQPAPRPGQAPAAPIRQPAPQAATPAITSQSLSAGVSFAPRLEKGAVTGFVVGPKGAGDVFAATGLKQGDIVTQINGMGVRSANDATAALSNVTASGQTSFTVERGGKVMTVMAGTFK